MEEKFGPTFFRKITGLNFSSNSAGKFLVDLQTNFELMRRNLWMIFFEKFINFNFAPLLPQNFWFMFSKVFRI